MVSGKIKFLVVKILGKLAPRLLLKIRISYKSGFEPELKLLPHLCSKDKTAIDVGAHWGLYSFYLMKYSKQCWAFEPIPKLSNLLQRTFGNSLVVESVALSNTSSVTQLRIPTNEFTLATIEQSNLLDDYDEVNEVNIKTRKLDDYEIPNIGFIKIDVEGHELAVLQGAKKTLDKFKPILLIEAEERHKPDTIKSIKTFLNEFGYKGYFLLNDKLHSIEEFKKKNHQDLTKLNSKITKEQYINNFVFLMPENINRVKNLLMEGI